MLRYRAFQDDGQLCVKFGAAALLVDAATSILAVGLFAVFIIAIVVVTVRALSQPVIDAGAVLFLLLFLCGFVNTSTRIGRHAGHVIRGAASRGITFTIDRQANEIRRNGIVEGPLSDLQNVTLTRSYAVLLELPGQGVRGHAGDDGRDYDSSGQLANGERGQKQRQL